MIRISPIREQLDGSSSSRISSCVVTSSAVDGSSAISRSGSRASAAAARPAGACRPRAGTDSAQRRRVLDPDLGEPANAPRRAAPSAGASRASRALEDVVAAAPERVQHRERILEHEPELPRRAAEPHSDRVGMSRPAKHDAPLRPTPGGSRRIIAFASIDLPLPDSPTIPIVSPCASRDVEPERISAGRRPRRDRHSIRTSPGRRGRSPVIVFGTPIREPVVDPVPIRFIAKRGGRSRPRGEAAWVLEQHGLALEEHATPSGVPGWAPSPRNETGERDERDAEVENSPSASRIECSARCDLS